MKSKKNSECSENYSPDTSAIRGVISNIIKRRTDSSQKHVRIRRGQKRSMVMSKKEQEQTFRSPLAETYYDQVPKQMLLKPINRLIKSRIIKHRVNNSSSDFSKIQTKIKLK